MQEGIFDGWNEQKKEINAREAIVINAKGKGLYKEGEIWWCAIGKNVGFEEDGKNELFERPVLVLKKFSKDVFFGLPMTSTRKESPYYYPYDLHETEGAVILSQGKLLSTKRLLRKMAKMGDDHLAEVRTAFRKMFE